MVVERETGLGRYREPLADGLSALRAPGPFLGFCAARHILAAAVLVTPTTAMTSATPRRAVILLPLFLRTFRRGAPGVVPGPSPPGVVPGPSPWLGPFAHISPYFTSPFARNVCEIACSVGVNGVVVSENGDVAE